MAIDLLSVREFKCFAAADVPLAGLTLFSGFNAAGKSTLLQSLLLLTQALRNSPNSQYLPLNGPMLRLGSAGDVVRHGASNPVKFQLRGWDSVLTWEFETEVVVESEKSLEVLGSEDGTVVDPEDEDGLSDDRRMRVLRVWDREKELFVGRRKVIRPPVGVAVRLKNQARNVVYLGATRHTSMDVFPAPEGSDPVYADVGHEGQFAPWWYVRVADNRVRSSRRFPDEDSVTMRAHIDAWLNHLFPGAAVNAETVQGTGLTKLLFKMSRRSAWARPANIGYGLSYAFPLIVALLNVRRGQIIVVDSPEAHLHPRAQSRVGVMLARFAASGVQILVETHSDHVLSGVRLAVRQQLLNASDVAIHFFSGVASEKTNGIISPVMSEDGRLSDWPSGFFDQSDADFAELAGL